MTTRALIPAAHVDWITGLTTDRVVKACGSRRLEIGRHVLRAGFASEEILDHAKIDRWFLVQIKKFADLREEPAEEKN